MYSCTWDGKGPELELWTGLSQGPRCGFVSATLPLSAAAEVRLFKRRISTAFTNITPISRFFATDRRQLHLAAALISPPPKCAAPDFQVAAACKISEKPRQRLGVR